MIGELRTSSKAAGDRLEESSPTEKPGVLRKDGLEVRVLCPVDGVVLQTGGPEDNWYLRVQPATKPPDLRHLLRGEGAGWSGKRSSDCKAAQCSPMAAF